MTRYCYSSGIRVCPHDITTVSTSNEILYLPPVLLYSVLHFSALLVACVYWLIPSQYWSYNGFFFVINCLSKCSGGFTRTLWKSHIPAAAVAMAAAAAAVAAAAAAAMATAAATKAAAVAWIGRVSRLGSWRKNKIFFFQFSLSFWFIVFLSSFNVFF